MSNTTIKLPLTVLETEFFDVILDRCSNDHCQAIHLFVMPKQEGWAYVNAAEDTVLELTFPKDGVAPELNPEYLEGAAVQTLLDHNIISKRPAELEVASNIYAVN